MQPYTAMAADKRVRATTVAASAPVAAACDGGQAHTFSVSGVSRRRNASLPRSQASSVWVGGRQRASLLFLALLALCIASLPSLVVAAADGGGGGGGGSDSPTYTFTIVQTSNLGSLFLENDEAAMDRIVRTVESVKGAVVVVDVGGAMAAGDSKESSKEMHAFMTEKLGVVATTLAGSDLACHSAPGRAKRHYLAVRDAATKAGVLLGSTYDCTDDGGATSEAGEVIERSVSVELDLASDRDVRSGSSGGGSVRSAKRKAQPSLELKVTFVGVPACQLHRQSAAAISQAISDATGNPSGGSGSGSASGSGSGRTGGLVVALAPSMATLNGLPSAAIRSLDAVLTQDVGVAGHSWSRTVVSGPSSVRAAAAELPVLLVTVAADPTTGAPNFDSLTLTPSALPLAPLLESEPPASRQRNQHQKRSASFRASPAADGGSGSSGGGEEEAFDGDDSSVGETHSPGHTGEEADCHTPDCDVAGSASHHDSGSSSSHGSESSVGGGSSAGGSSGIDWTSPAVVAAACATAIASGLAFLLNSASSRIAVLEAKLAKSASTPTTPATPGFTHTDTPVSQAVKVLAAMRDHIRATAASSGKTGAPSRLDRDIEFVLNCLLSDHPYRPAFEGDDFEREFDPTTREWIGNYVELSRSKSVSAIEQGGLAAAANGLATTTENLVFPNLRRRSLSGSNVGPAGGGPPGSGRAVGSGAGGGGGGQHNPRRRTSVHNLSATAPMILREYYDSSSDEEGGSRGSSRSGRGGRASGGHVLGLGDEPGSPSSPHNSSNVSNASNASTSTTTSGAGGEGPGGATAVRQGSLPSLPEVDEGSATSSDPAGRSPRDGAAFSGDLSNTSDGSGRGGQGTQGGGAVSGSRPSTGPLAGSQKSSGSGGGGGSGLGGGSGASCDSTNFADGGLDGGDSSVKSLTRMSSAGSSSSKDRFSVVANALEVDGELSRTSATSAPPTYGRGGDRDGSDDDGGGYDGGYDGDDGGGSDSGGSEGVNANALSSMSFAASGSSANSRLLADLIPDSSSGTPWLPWTMMDKASGSPERPLSVDEAAIAKIVRADVLDDWSFDIFELAQLSYGRPLFYLARSVFEAVGLLDDFDIDDGTLSTWLVAVESSYHANPYHNSIHAADVLHAMYYFLCRERLGAILTPLEKLSLVVSAAVHDVDHPGVNNTFLVATFHPLARRYNDRSVLENHHAATAFDQMQSPATDILACLSDTEVVKVRDLVIDLILATDISLHFSYVTKFKTKLETNGLDTSEESDRRLLMELAIKCADLSNPTKPLDLCVQWTDRIMEEFFNQGDRERDFGLPISKFFDRTAPTVPQCQMGFIDFLVGPMFKTFADYVDSEEVSICNEKVSENRAYWAKRKQEDVDAGIIPPSPST